MAETKILTTKTDYQSLTILRNRNQLVLLSGDAAVQSIIHRRKPHQLELANLRALMAVLLFLPAPQNICLLGVGGGALIHFLRYHYPKSRLTAVEIDATLIKIMQAQMGLTQADETLCYIIEDAACYLQDCRQVFDLIIVDLFLGDQSPDWLLTTESMQWLGARLSPTGGIAYNLLINEAKHFEQYYQNLRQTFDQQTLALPVDGLDNTIAFAFSRQPDHSSMTAYLHKARTLGSQHGIDYLKALSSIYQTNPVGSGII